MNNQQNFITAIMICAFIFTMGKIAESAAQFVAMSLFLIVPVAIGFVTLSILRVVKSKFTTPATTTHKNTRKSTCERVVNAVPANAKKGTDIMDIPAYARKARNTCYPMTKDLLNGYMVKAN